MLCQFSLKHASCGQCSSRQLAPTDKSIDRCMFLLLFCFILTLLPPQHIVWAATKKSARETNVFHQKAWQEAAPPSLLQIPTLAIVPRRQNKAPAPVKSSFANHLCLTKLIRVVDCDGTMANSSSSSPLWTTCRLLCRLHCTFASSQRVVSATFAETFVWRHRWRLAMCASPFRWVPPQSFLPSCNTWMLVLM